MFTARNPDGHRHARPLTTKNKGVGEDSSLSFFMSRAGDPVADIGEDPSANVSYADVGCDGYISVSGIAAVVEDLAKKRQLWSKMAQAWFPGGAEDRDRALVQVKISHAAYWDVKGSRLVQLFKVAAAAVTGKRPTGIGDTPSCRCADVGSPGKPPACACSDVPPGASRCLRASAGLEESRVTGRPAQTSSAATLHRRTRGAAKSRPTRVRAKR